MSSVEYTDDFVNAAIERLRDEMPAAIDEINDRYADAYPLLHPKGYSNGTENRVGTPWLEVYIGEDELGPDPETGYFTLGVDTATATFPLAVLIYHDEAVPGPILHTKLKRYAGAVTKVIVDREAFLAYAPTLRRIRRVWRLSETEHDEIESLAWVRFEFTMDVLI